VRLATLAALAALAAWHGWLVRSQSRDDSVSDGVGPKTRDFAAQQ